VFVPQPAIQKWCLRCCSIVVSSKGRYKAEQNCTKKKKPTKCPKFKCNTVSVSFSACRCSSVVFSSKVGREKKKSLETGLWMAIWGCGLPARCCQSAVAGGVIYADFRNELNTPLAQQALFTQSPVRKPLLQAFPFPSTLREVTLHLLSQSCVFIYSSHGKWVFPFSCGVFLPLLLLQAFLLLLTGRCCCSCQPAYLFTAHMGSGSSLLSCGVFLPPPPSQAFLLLVAGRAPPRPPEPLRPARLVYLQSREGFPSPNLQHSGCPTLFALCLYYSYCLLVSFCFFPGCGSSVQGVCWSGPGLSMEVPHTT
jgi:hypothetical protein